MMRVGFLTSVLLAAVTGFTAASAAGCDDYLLNTTAASPSGVVTVEGINAILTEHNDARKAVYPYAKVMPQLQWSQVLADFAQENADKCNFAHTQHASRADASRFGWSYVGENIAGFTSSTFDVMGGAKGVKLWNDEITDWTFPQACTSGKACGHYTQNIWASTTHVGCGGTKCGGSVYWFCNYGPGGNYIGADPYTQTSSLSEAAGCTNETASKSTTDGALATIGPVGIVMPVLLLLLGLLF